MISSVPDLLENYREVFLALFDHVIFVLSFSGLILTFLYMQLFSEALLGLSCVLHVARSV